MPSERKTARRALCAAQALVLLFLAACGLASCGGTDAAEDRETGTWQIVVLKEYDAVVRDIRVMSDGIAAVYYDMEAEDYAYDLFSDDDAYLGTVRPSAFSGCPRAKLIAPYDGGCLLLDREHGLWSITGTQKDGCRAERLYTFDEDPADLLFFDGLVYCAQGSDVRALTLDGKTAFTAGVGDEARRLLVSGGELYVQTRDEAARSDSVRLVSPNGRSAEIRLPNLRFLDLAAAPGHELYLRDGSGLFFSDNGRTDRLVGFTASGVAPEFITCWAVRDESTVYTAESDYYREGDVSRLSVLRRGQAGGEAALPTLRVGCIRIPSDLDIAAAELMREGTARVEWVDYGAKADPQTELMGDILSGDVPDVLLLDGVDGREEYLRLGLFADLTPYLEASGDQGLIAAARPFMTDGGSLYELPSSVSVSLLAVCGDLPDMTVDGFLDYAESLIEAGKRPLAETDPPALLSLLLTASIPDFISDGFDSPSFGRLLRFCREYPKQRFGSDEPVIRPWQLYGYEGLARLESRVPGAAVAGWPSSSGGAFTLVTGDSAAIWAASKHKDAGWRLLLLYREAVRSRTNEERSLPFAVTDAERSRTEELAAKIEYFFYHNGGEASAFLEADGSCWLDRLTEADGVRAKVTLETIACCDDLLASASRPTADSLAVRDIIEEEASYYFAGAKPLDETVRIIASRVGIYLAEKDIG